MCENYLFMLNKNNNFAGSSRRLQKDFQVFFKSYVWRGIGYTVPMDIFLTLIGECGISYKACDGKNICSKFH